jgi:hypothetical protein
MNNVDLQLTIRGIDLLTKQQLTKKAALKGISLNNLVVGALKQTAGTNTSEERLQIIHETLNKYRIPGDDIIAAEIAVAEMDTASKEKQKRDNHDLSF